MKQVGAGGEAGCDVGSFSLKTPPVYSPRQARLPVSETLRTSGCVGEATFLFFFFLNGRKAYNFNYIFYTHMGILKNFYLKCH